ncbi:hypothetical protein [Kaistella polysaccharea]|uniref:hypothetical protein n=1 Tax=Kaistella polysaccharea TaxID=2878534 RepID=UPI001CF4FD71|nr:hypothetical protein [Kaistella polysaccharea]
MKNFIATAIIVLFAIACEKKSNETVITDQSNIDSVVIPETNEPIQSSTVQTCYMEASGKDTLFMTLEDNLGTFIGKMRYKNFEKDSSFGTLIGNQNGDTIKLVYNFESEGTTSDREIYFLKKDGQLIEGIGDYETEGSNSTYKSPLKIKFEGHALKQVDCTNFDDKLSSK